MSELYVPTGQASWAFDNSSISEVSTSTGEMRLVEVPSPTFPWIAFNPQQLAFPSCRSTQVWYVSTDTKTAALPNPDMTFPLGVLRLLVVPSPC